MSNRVKEVQDLGQSIWYDNIERGALISGEMKRLIGEGVTGVTSNPTIFHKAVTGSDVYDDPIRELAKKGLDSFEIYDTLLMEDVAEAADLLRPVYESTDGRDGYVSIEPNPALAYDTEGTVKEIRRILDKLDRPNIMAKVPGTQEGLPAIEQLLSEGRNINITLLFSLETYIQVAQAYTNGLEKLDANGGDVSKVASVASFFVSRIDTTVDKLLDEIIEAGKGECVLLKGSIAIACCQIVYSVFKEVFENELFVKLQEKGARLQRPLWASTSTKNPNYKDTMYVDNLIAADTVNTVPKSTLEAFQDHGNAVALLQKADVDKPQGAKYMVTSLTNFNINLREVVGELLKDGVRQFSESQDELLESIDEKRKQVSAG